MRRYAANRFLPIKVRAFLEFAVPTLKRVFAETWLLLRLMHQQLGNPVIRTTQPSTKLTVDILHDQDIGVNICLVIRVEISRCKFKQNRRALRGDGG